MEEALDAWCTQERDSDTLRDIMDGAVWKELKGVGDELFFDNSPDRKSPDELRIGVTFGFDG